MIFLLICTFLKFLYNDRKGEKMIDFIKRNKVFSICLFFCISTIIGLSSLALINRFSDDVPITLIPSIKEPDEKKDPVFSNFTGHFLDENNVVELSWKTELNGHKLIKLELYRNSELVEDCTDKTSTQLPIHLYNLKTGNNEFEMRLYYDEGIVLSTTTNVFIEYLFDVQMNHQLVDNNLGKGYLLSIKYSYNPSTPVGVPRVNVNSTYPDSWNFKYLGNQTTELRANYVQMESYFLIEFDHAYDENITWNISYIFDSVGVRHNDAFTEKINDFKIENIELTKQVEF